MIRADEALEIRFQAFERERGNLMRKYSDIFNEIENAIIAASNDLRLSTALIFEPKDWFKTPEDEKFFKTIMEFYGYRISQKELHNYDIRLEIKWQ